jgi:hypothetical protein
MCASSEVRKISMTFSSRSQVLPYILRPKRLPRGGEMHAQTRNVKVLATVAALLVLGVGGGIAYATGETEDRATGPGL